MRLHVFSLCCSSFIFALWGCTGETSDSASTNTPAPLAATTALLAPGTAHTYPKTSGPTQNPHKGWSSGWFDTFEEASVGFQYLSWGDFEPQDNGFDFAKVEQIIDRKGSANKHFVLRLYCDWGPTDLSSHCPSWLHNMGVPRIQGAGGTYITDYNHPTFVAQAVQAIEALASRYNTDPRVHAFQIGILGYWGEWHTHGFSYASGAGGYVISDSTRNAILKAYKDHFTQAKIQGRYPWEATLQTIGGIGFHNDYFLPNNSHSGDFDTAVSTNHLWLNGPIGGETPPRSDAQRASELQVMHTTPTGQNMIAKGHYSTMNGGYRVDPTHPYAASSMALHRMMGYNYQIDNANFADTLAKNETLSVQVTVQNIGIAPLYHDWSVQLALLNSNNEVVALAPANIALSTLTPGSSSVLSANLPTQLLAPNDYQLALRVLQPGADAPKMQPWKLDARNAYILFANDLSTTQGTWGLDHALQGGWSLLGPVRLQ